MEYIPLSKLFYSDTENYKKIYNKRFNSEYTTHLNFFINGHRAFFTLLPSFYSKLIEIYKIDKKIKALCDILPGKAIEHFARRCLIDEIILTNNIEGVHSTRREISSVLTELNNTKKKKRFMGLVQKYLILMCKEELLINSCEDIRDLYNDLVYNEIEEDDPENLPDGKIFRKDSASVLSPTQKEIHRGINPESEIINSMNEALKILYDNSIECIFRISIFHYLFGYIHPFYDGNGRTSRFISSYLLSKEFEPIIGYRLAYSIKESSKDYYEAFKICNNPHNLGDLTPFVLMFSDIISNSMHHLLFAMEKRFKQLQQYISLIYLLPFGANSKFSELYSLLIQASLFSEYGISTLDLIDMLQVSRTTVKNRLCELDKYELIEKTSEGKTNYYRLNLSKIDEIADDTSEN